MMKSMLSALGCGLLLCLAAPAAAQSVTAGTDWAGEALVGCRTDLRYLHQLSGWQLRWPQEWEALGAASDDGIRQAIAEWKSAPAALRADQEALATSGKGRGVAPRVVVERVLAQVDDLSKSLGRGAPALRADAAPALQAEWRRLFSDEIGPAVERYRAFLRDTYLPRSSLSPSLGEASGDAGCYGRAVRYFMGFDMPVAEIEATGERLMREAEADLMKLHGIGPEGLPALLQSLRAYEEKGFTAGKLLAIFDAAIARAGAAMPRIFARPAERPVVVQALPERMQASFVSAYYRSSNGDAPAAFVANLSRPEERRVMAEVVAFHEALPGHHAREALGYPPGAFNSGFGEGWAIYAEYLADELGLYSSALDRSGMMAKHIWAASRLVVEPGLHVHGWTRDQAVAFMRARTALTEAEIQVEVDRYVATPGQSLSYMLGYDRIARARRHAEAALGPAFDIREFHEVVLGKGSRPVDEVEADVLAWMKRKREG